MEKEKISIIGMTVVGLGILSFNKVFTGAVVGASQNPTSFLTYAGFTLLIGGMAMVAFQLSPNVLGRARHEAEPGKNEKLIDKLSKQYRFGDASGELLESIDWQLHLRGTDIGHLAWIANRYDPARALKMIDKAVEKNPEVDIRNFINSETAEKDDVTMRGLKDRINDYIVEGKEKKGKYVKTAKESSGNAPGKSAHSRADSQYHGSYTE